MIPGSAANQSKNQLNKLFQQQALRRQLLDGMMEKKEIQRDFQIDFPDLATYYGFIYDSNEKNQVFIYSDFFLICCLQCF